MEDEDDREGFEGAVLGWLPLYDCPIVPIEKGARCPGTALCCDSWSLAAIAEF